LYKYVLALPAALDVAWLRLDDDVDGNHQRGRALRHVEGSLLDIGASNINGMLMQKYG